MKIFRSIILAACAGSALGASAADVGTVVATDAYSWRGDTIFQGPFKAWAVTPYEIKSTYRGRPGYFMPVEQSWSRKNDLSSYPRLSTPNKLHQAVYNLALDEMVNAVEPDTTLRTGKEWAGVWTRDVSYSIILAMASLQPEASMISLMKKVNPSGQIIQDTGSGGAWPVSTDRMIWVLAAWEVYKATGDRKWLETIYPVAVRSLDKDEKTIFSADGLVKGETSFIDWREQSYPKWMQTADISQSEAMNTNVLYAAAMQATGDMALILGKKKDAERWFGRSDRLAAEIDRRFWMDDKGYYGMYTYGRDSKILNPRAESLGEALAVIYGIAPGEKVKTISENVPQTPFGAAIFYPQIADMPNYHNNALWPFVGAYLTIAHALAGNEEATLEGIGSIFRPAALFCTNKENFNLDNGDYYTELNSSNMLWCLSGNLALTQRVLFGIKLEKDGILFRPFVPRALGAERTLENFPYRGGRLDITVEGFGSGIKEIYLDGKRIDTGGFVSAKRLAKTKSVRIVLDSRIEPMKVNRVANRKAPLTPTAWLEDGRLVWNPIEYSAGYIVVRDGKEVARTRLTSWPADGEAEWQVITLDAEGTPSFASEPRSTRKASVIQFPDEKTVASSAEISYRPASAIEGFTGAGFAETDTKSTPLSVEVNVPEAGEYTVAVRYANGNGPVNTENKCAVRTLKVDGRSVGTLVLPHRGVANWDDWGMSNLIRVSLPAGKSLLTIEYLPEDENMNITTNHALLDHIRLEKAAPRSE